MGRMYGRDARDYAKHMDKLRRQANPAPRAPVDVVTFAHFTRRPGIEGDIREKARARLAIVSHPGIMAIEDIKTVYERPEELVLKMRTAGDVSLQHLLQYELTGFADVRISMKKAA